MLATKATKRVTAANIFAPKKCLNFRECDKYATLNMRRGKCAQVTQCRSSTFWDIVFRNRRPPTNSILFKVICFCNGAEYISPNVECLWKLMTQRTEDKGRADAVCVCNKPHNNNTASTHRWTLEMPSRGGRWDGRRRRDSNNKRTNDEKERKNNNRMLVELQDGKQQKKPVPKYLFRVQVPNVCGIICDVPDSRWTHTYLWMSEGANELVSELYWRHVQMSTTYGPGHHCTIILMILFSLK